MPAVSVGLALPKPCLPLPEPPDLPDIFPIKLGVTPPTVTLDAALCCKLHIEIDPSKYIPIPLLAVIPEPAVITTIRVAVNAQLEIIKNYLRLIPRDCPLE